MSKNPPAMQETQLQSLGQNSPQSRKWQPTLVFLPGKSHDRGAWGVTVHGAAKEYDTTKQQQAMYSVQFSSITQSCLTFHNPMEHSTPGLPVHHQFPDFTQTHLHRIGDAIQPPHPLSSPSPAFNLSQHQGLFK